MRAIEKNGGSATDRLRAMLARPYAIGALVTLLCLAALGSYVRASIEAGETLVENLYDEALMSAAAARNAADAFAQMLSAEDEYHEQSTLARRSERETRFGTLMPVLSGNLDTVVERARSLRASQAALFARDAAKDWLASVNALDQGGDLEALRAELDRHAMIARAQFALLVHASATDAASARVEIAAAFSEQRRLVAGVGAATILLAGLAAWIGAHLGSGRRPAPVGEQSAERRSAADRPAPEGMPSLDREATSKAETAKAEIEQLAAENRMLHDALDEMSLGLCLYGPDHRLALVNGRYSEVYRLKAGAVAAGMEARAVLALSIEAGNHPGRSLDDLLADVAKPFADGEDNCYVQELDDGRAVQIRARPTAQGGFVATYEDVTERWHAEARIAHMARHDILTSLPNRVLLAERIEGAITLASRDSGFALFCLDLDNFKQINDTLGHSVGDELLRAVAHRLAACLREVDTVARLGGDEFAIVQAGTERAEDAAILARRIVEVVSAPYALSDHSVTVGVSIGIALAPRDGLAADKLMKNADVALYRAKGEGRGTFRLFESEMDARIQARRQLELDLRDALETNAFELHYQPIYDLRQDRICGFEALLRWNHPTRGRVSPMEFIPLAEEIGLIVPLGEWVMRAACAEARGWPDDLKVAVNVSPAQFQSAQLIEVVRSSLAESGLAPHRLEVEITESVLLVNGNATIAILHALRTIGARISMDDFGTGYSSLSYLRSFPFDKMKIDKSFIRDLVQENGSGFIVRAVISLGSSLGMTMTAEGVETEEQLARLREEGCDEVQGFLFSPPVPATQVPGLLTKWNEPARVAA